MAKAKRTGVAALMVLGVVLAMPTAHAAPATQCTGNITGGTYGSIEVPARATCKLTNVTVTGQVTAREDSTLMISSSDLKHVHGLKAEVVHLFDNDITGNVHIHHGETNDPATDIHLDGNDVNGNVHIHHNAGTIRVEDNDVDGHILIQHNHSRLVIHDNEVGKMLQVMMTTSSSAKDVTRNTADQLHCHKNAAPFTGGPNKAPKVQGTDCFAS